MMFSVQHCAGVADAPSKSILPRPTSVHERDSFSNPFGTSLPQQHQHLASATTIYQHSAGTRHISRLGKISPVTALSPQLVLSESQGALEALFNSRVQEKIAPFIRQTRQGSRTSWPYEDNMPKEKVYGDNQCRVQ